MDVAKKMILALGLSATLIAERPEPCAPCPDPCSPPPDPCAKCAQIWPTRGPDWIITPSAGPCVACGFDAHVTVDFIYWSVREDHLAFAYKQPIQPLANGTTTTSCNSTIHPDWNFRPGFKLGVGYLYDHDGWDIHAEYTWMRVQSTKKSASSIDQNTEAIFTIWPFFDALDSISSISAGWELDFNVIDVELARNFFMSRYLKLRPHLGLKGTWQDQRLEMFADGLRDNFESRAFDEHNLDYWGIGIRAGLDTTWHFNRCFSLFGEFALTALWETFDAKEKLSVAPLEPGATSPLTLLYAGNEIRTIKPILELYMGLRWESWFCCDRYHFSIEAGWEEQWWASQNQLFDDGFESRLGDLSLHGLTLKLRIDF